MIFLFIFCNSYGNVLAGPLPPSLHQTEALCYSLETDPSRFTQRSNWNIIWGCFATLFACSWLAIHLNIPAKSDGSMRKIFRRLMIMAYMLIIPEMVILWASRQWQSANYIANKHKDQGWTRTHGFFVVMGGFMLCDENDKMIETLSIERLEELALVGKIRWPSISEEEIEDRSKRDAFSKCFAVLQTTWFITQCIARGVYGLTITELEVVTLAFAALNGVLYFLWWNKPQDVACPVAVYFTSHHPSSNREISGMQTTDPQYGEHFEDDTLSTHENPVLSVTKMDSATPELKLSVFARFSSYCWRFGYMMSFPIRMFLRPLEQMTSCDSLTGSRPLSVPTFYSPKVNQGLKIVYILFLIGALFGGIHCIAWSFTFQSAEEKYIWRISAVIITAVPFAFAGALAVDWIKTCGPWSVAEYFPLNACEKFLRGNNIAIAMKILVFIWNKISQIILTVFIIIYMAYLPSRAALLILPLLALRSLSPESLLDVNWSSFIPHIY